MKPFINFTAFSQSANHLPDFNEEGAPRNRSRFGHKENESKADQRERFLPLRRESLWARDEEKKDRQPDSEQRPLISVEKGGPLPEDFKKRGSRRGRTRARRLLSGRNIRFVCDGRFDGGGVVRVLSPCFIFHDRCSFSLLLRWDVPSRFPE